LNCFDKIKVRVFGNFVSGTELFYIGRQYQLIVEKREGSGKAVLLGKSKITVFTPAPSDAEFTKNIFKDWLKVQTGKELKSALNRCMTKFSDINPPELRIRKLSKRWGSYQKGVIILNSNLIFKSKKCMDYVITHEPCHFFSDCSAA